MSRTSYSQSCHERYQPRFQDLYPLKVLGTRLERYSCPCVHTLFTYDFVNHRLRAWLLLWRVAHMWSSSTTLVQDLLTSSTGQSECGLGTGIQHMRHGQLNVTCYARLTWHHNGHIWCFQTMRFLSCERVKWVLRLHKNSQNSSICRQNVLWS